MKKTFLLLAFLLPVFAFAQSAKYPVTNIPVMRNGVEQTNAWAGGLNAPQFSAIDLNNDGVKDLFVFDRGADRVLTFLNDGGHSDTAFHYAPEYEKIFPRMTQWATIRDYNHDGVPDIFTYQDGQIDLAPVGVKIYKGRRIGNNLHFDAVQPCLTYHDNGFAPPLWVNGLGVPVIEDMNNDGDLDILTFNVYGTQVEYYESQVVEQNLQPDSMWFTEASKCWGSFYVGSSANLQVSLGVSCKGGEENPMPGFDYRHSGAGMSAIDNGDDHDIDLLVSGVHSKGLDLLNNTGNAQFAQMGWQDTLWPSCTVKSNMPYFPGAYKFDGDNDGVDDLLISPIFSSPALDVKNVQFYKKHTGDTCGYEYSGSDSFLVHTMLDFGTDSKAVFFDYNGDSLMDIIVGNYGYYDLTVPAISKLALYQNIGTRTAPAYREVTTDFANLSVYSTGATIQGFNPSFGDLDGDHKADMLAGIAGGNFYFFKNTGGSTAAFPSVTAANFNNLSVPGYAAPFLFDVNGDGLTDIVAGNINGTLTYFWNYGNASTPLFSNDSANENFGGINVRSASSITGYSQPFIMRDSANNMLLFVGSEQGLVFEYAIDTTKLRTGAFAKLDSNFLKYDIGSKATLQAYDLNGDGKLEYLTGNALGGIQLFSETIWDTSAILSAPQAIAENSFSVYPNPANTTLVCAFNSALNHPEVQIYDCIGQRMHCDIALSANKISISTIDLAAGLYIVQVLDGGQSYSSKVLIRH